MDSLNVFISSTWMDMIPEREAVEQASHRLRSIRFVGMEYFGSRSESTRQVSLDELDHSQVYVGVLGHRYGSGITEAEYRRAIERGLPCLIYLKDGAPAADSPSDENAQCLASLRREMQAKHTVSLFRDAHDLAARVVADLHNLVFDRLVVQGIGQLHAGYDARIQRFLAEYVGTVDSPIAFGGREQELHALDRWLTDPRAPAYAMLGAPAGRGKSALLVHWAQRLALQGDVSLIYFPISIRFRTNLASVAFASIAARLAALHGEALPAGQETPPEVWRELMSAYLRRAVPEGRRFLMILDGADESADWQPGPDLFPAKPPERLRVLVSARYLAGDVDTGGWLARLGWTRPRSAYPLDLSPLTPEGLVDVLRQMSLPLDALSARADVVAELYRLSGGDPLLVNLYVSDLWARGEEVARLQPEDLAGLQPGLDGYFGRWWDDQRTLWGTQSPLREPAVNDVLNTLACALGPLRTSELLDLLPSDSGVELWALDDFMRALQRFVIGDGEAQGYAFSHPRLGDYFYDRLAKAGRAQKQELRFVSWGLACLDELDRRLGTSAEVPTYLLHYLRPHMERAGSNADAFLALASKAWASAWERLDRGSYTGFLADLDRVREIATRENSLRAAQGQRLPFMAAEIRCALCASSIATLAAEMSIGLLKALIAREIWSPAQAIAYATRIPDARSRLRGLFELTAAMAQAYRPLAVAAALTETRALLANDAGRAVVYDVLHGLSRPAEPNSSPTETARLFEAVGQLARQGLAPPQQRWIIDTVAECALLRDGPPEQVATVLRALLPLLDEPVATDARLAADAALRELVASPDDADMSMAVERLSLLRAALEDRGDDDAEPWLTEALRAGLKVLTAAAVTGATPPEAALDLALVCWRCVPTADVIASIESLAPTLTPRHLDELLGDIAQWPRAADRLNCLTVLLYRVPAEARARVTLALTVALREAKLPAADISHQLQLAADALSTDELAASLDQTADALTPADRIALCGALARARPEADLRAHLANCALGAMAQLSTIDERLDAIAALLDGLQPPGSSDSFEPWRPAPERRPLALRIRQVLVLGKPSCAETWATAQRLVQALSPMRPDAPYFGLQNRMVVVARLIDAARVEATDGSPPSALAASLIERLRAGALDPEELPDAVASLDPPLGFADTLLLLREVASAIPSDTVRHTVAHVVRDSGNRSDPEYADVPPPELARIPAIVASGPLYPPVSDTLEALRKLAHALWSRADADDALLDPLLRTESMPDIIRHELLAAALTHRVRHDSGGPALAALLLDVGRLAHAPDDLVALALSALREDGRVPPTERPQILERLMPFVERANLLRWLDEVGTLDAAVLKPMLRRFEQMQLVDGESHWRQIINAVRQVRSPRRRAEWIEHLASFLPASVVPDALTMARGIGNEQDQLRALCALIPLMPRSQRGAVLIEALKLARRMEGTSTIGHTLVQMVLDANEDSQPLLAEATATAVAISDKALRGTALAQLAAVLGVGPMADAASASLRLDDAAARVRAMRAFAVAVVDPAQRQSAVDRMLTAIHALPAGSVRDVAILYASPLIAPAARWPAIGAAIQTVPDRPTGFEHAELLDALRDALPDAPARLMVQAFAWIRHMPPSVLRSRTLTSLVPTLPNGLVLPAIVMISDHPDDESVSIIAPYISARDLARARTYGQRLPAPARSVLARIAKINETAGLSIDRPLLSSPSPEPVDAALRSATSDVQRASTLQWLALGRDVSAACRRRLIEATTRLGDRTLRIATTRYLAVLCADRSLTRARDAVATIDSAGDRSLATLCLAARHRGPARDSLMQRALASAAAEAEPLPRLEAAVEIAVAAPALLTSVIECIGSTAETEPKARALRELMWRLADAEAAVVVGASERLLCEDRSGRLLMDVADALEPVAAEAALSALAAMRKAVTRARLLASLVARLDDEHQHACVEVMERIETDFAWVEALGAVSARWPSVLTHERATRACANLVTIGDDQFSGAWLEKAAAYWPTSAWPEFAETARTLLDAALRCDVLCAGIRTCEGKLPAGLLAAAREIDSGFHRSVVLGHAASINQPVDEALLAEALQVAHSIGQRDLYLDTLVGIAETAGTVAPPVFEALTAEFRTQPSRIAQALLDVSPWLGRDQAFQVLRGMEPAGMRSMPTMCADLLFSLAPRLAAEDLPWLLQEIPKLCREREGSALLCDLAPLVEDDASQACALAVALSMQGETFRAQALIGLAEWLNPQRQQELVAALADTRLETERVRRLAVVWSKIAPDAKGQWREAAARIRNPDFAAMLMAHTKTPGQADGEAHRHPLLAATSAGDSDADIDLNLDTLLDELMMPGHPALSPVQQRAGAAARNPPGFTELVARLGRIEPEMDRFDELMRGLPVLSAGEMVAVLDVLPQHLAADHQDDALIRIVALLPPSERERALPAVGRIHSAARVKRVLSALLPHLGDDARPAWHALWWEAMHGASRGGRSELLSLIEAWVPVIARLGGDVALLHTIEAIDDVGSLWP